MEELSLYLQDHEWPMTGIDHDRLIARAVVVDDDGYFYFVKTVRTDRFGSGTFIETSGGGVEAGEDLLTALRRELKEELGAEVEILGKIGIVSDYYNLIHRHNINNYYLCRATSFGEKHLTLKEQQAFQLSTLRLRMQDALDFYQQQTCSPVGRLISAREMPVLQHAMKMLETGKGWSVCKY